jgi:hypothetical protein
MITFIRASEKRMDTLKERIMGAEPGSRWTRLVNLSETRWVERHDAISFFKKMLMPIYDTLGIIMGCDDMDVSLKSFLMWSAMEKSCLSLVSAVYREFSVWLHTYKQLYSCISPILHNA